MAYETRRSGRSEERSRQLGPTADARSYGAWPYGAGYLGPGYMGYPGYTSFPWSRSAHGADPIPDPWRGEERGRSSEMASWAPRTEMLERDDRLIVRVELPGLDKDDVNVCVENDCLFIEGERRDEESEGTGRYYRRELSYGRFHREIPLPEPVDYEDVKAKFKNGILEVSIPRSERPERRPVRIDS